MTSKYLHNLNAWQEQIYNSGRYTVFTVYTDHDACLGNAPPSYITLEEHATYNRHHLCVIRGELAQLFIKEFNELHYTPVAWPQPPMYKFLGEWVTRMDNIDLALRAMGHKPKQRFPQGEPWDGGR